MKNFLLAPIILSICTLFSNLAFSNDDELYNMLLNNILKYSPEDEAENIYKSYGPKLASEFINFYITLDNKKNSKLDQLLNKYESERGNIAYKGKEILKGIIGINPSEGYSNTIDDVSYLVPYVGDIKYLMHNLIGLHEEWKNYINGEDINKINIGLSGIGCVITLSGLLPGIGHSTDSVKKTHRIMCSFQRLMKIELKRNVINIFKPVFQLIYNLNFTGLEYTNFDDIKNTLISKSEELKRIVEEFQNGMNNFPNLIKLYMSNWEVAELVVPLSSTIDEIEDYSKIALLLDNNDRNIIKFGGETVLIASYYLYKNNNLDIDILKQYMKFGSDGIRAIGIIPIETIHKYKDGI